MASDVTPSEPGRSAEWHSAVSQVGNLQAARKSSDVGDMGAVLRLHGQPTASRRYSRLSVCAMRFPAVRMLPRMDHVLQDDIDPHAIPHLGENERTLATHSL